MTHGGSVLDADPRVIAVLRMRVSTAGRLVYGEAIEVETEQLRRFTTWAGLANEVRDLVAASLAGTTGTSSDGPVQVTRTEETSPSAELRSEA